MPAWVTVKACPAIVSVPLRVAPVLASKVKLAVPLPVPLAVVCSHEAFAVAVHASRGDDDVGIAPGRRAFEQGRGPEAATQNGAVLKRLELQPPSIRRWAPRELLIEGRAEKTKP